MQNGYLFPTNDGLNEISKKLQQSTEDELDNLRGDLRIGLQWQAGVTLPGASHKVSQAYCSALPVAYGRQPTEQWTDFAKLILDAAYEATLSAAVINASQTGVNTVYLTMLGGGVFGNRDQWISHGRRLQSHPAMKDIRGMPAVRRSRVNRVRHVKQRTRDF